MNIWIDTIKLGPITSLSVFILIGILLKSFIKKSELPVLINSFVALITSLILSLYYFSERGAGFGNMMLIGGYANYFLIAISLVGILFLMQLYSKINSIQNFSEFVIVSMSSILGMMILSAASDLVTMFLGLELMSIAFYIMAGFDRKNLKSNESSLKYFLLGAFATGFFLYGVALIYGSTGTTNLIQLFSVQQNSVKIPIYLIGYFFILIGFGFKVALAPFHMWSPDVYEGAPTSAVSLMSSGGKISAFSAFMLLFSIPLNLHVDKLILVFSILAAASMIIGNIFGLAQKNLKRMLAYSSVAHGGYILIGIASGMANGREGIAFYLVSYALTNLGAFGIISYLEDKIENVDYENIAGLGKTNPMIAFLLSIFMFSLVGIPPLAGFVGKYLLFLSAVESNLIWLAIVGVVTSVVSLYYYLRIVVQMYFREPAIEQNFEKSNLNLISFIIVAFILVVLGIVPSLLLKYTSQLM